MPFDWSQFQSSLEFVIGGFPVFGAMAVAWFLAERRAIEARQHADRSERRVREVLRDACGMPSEGALNGETDS